MPKKSLKIKEKKKKFRKNCLEKHSGKNFPEKTFWLNSPKMFLEICLRKIILENSRKHFQKSSRIFFYKIASRKKLSWKVKKKKLSKKFLNQNFKKKKFLKNFHKNFPGKTFQINLQNNFQKKLSKKKLLITFRKKF